MTSFGAAVGDLIDACEKHEDFAQVQRALLVRDLKGRLRLVLSGDAAVEPLAARLEATLSARLGGWFSPPILTTADALPGRRRLAQELIKAPEERWPIGWPEDRVVDPLSGERQLLPGARWRARQAILSKSPWLTGATSRPPWPLHAKTPRITAFYSFKGGVGRSTTLAILAGMLARQGRQVVVIDLDLEAPGLTPILLASDAPLPETSVLDYLLQETATGHPPQDLPLVPVSMGGADLSLVPAGRLTPAYLEQLARLDLVGRDPGSAESPVSQALVGLLKRIRARTPRPDHIFIDCRTGLNDLGGVALADLAHVDVLVSRDGRADIDGLRLILSALSQRRQGAERRLTTVQTFLFDPIHTAAGRAVHEAHREAQYDAFCEHWYTPDDLPDIRDEQQPHHPFPIPFDRGLSQLRWLGEARESLWDTEEYQALLRRLEGLWAPEDTDERA